MEHLRLFETESEYLGAKDDFVYPNVSYVMEDEMLYYMKSSNYEFVDLGLASGLKWATCNIGATKPEESGLYFAWGEDKGYMVTKGDAQDATNGVYTAVITNADGTETTKTFASDFSDYEHVESGDAIKYNGTDGLTTLENEDDGCYLAEKTMRMPTKEECEELINGTDSTWVLDYNGTSVAGRLFTSKTNGNSIFVPAVGGVYDGVLSGFGLIGGFWSSSLFSGNVEGAFYLVFGEGGLAGDNGSRFSGLPLRAVCP